MEKRTVKQGVGILPTKMTLMQAYRWGDKNMPRYLKRAKFNTTVFESDPEIDGSSFYRVSWGRKA